jgi:hypothetical protein
MAERKRYDKAMNSDREPKVSRPHLRDDYFERSKGRDRITNGAVFSRDIDGRTAYARRFRDLLVLHTNDLGDDPSEAERAIIRRAVTLIITLEHMELRFAANADGVTPAQIDCYQRAASTMRRLLESIGLKRRQRDVTPDLASYLKQPRMTERPRFADGGA